MLQDGRHAVKVERAEDEMDYDGVCRVIGHLYLEGQQALEESRRQLKEKDDLVEKLRGDVARLSKERDDALNLLVERK